MPPTRIRLRAALTSGEGAPPVLPPDPPPTELRLKDDPAKIPALKRDVEAVVLVVVGVAAGAAFCFPFVNVLSQPPARAFPRPAQAGLDRLTAITAKQAMLKYFILAPTHADIRKRGQLRRRMQAVFD